MTTARSQHAATLLADGRVLITGGGEPGAEIYDPTTGTFAATGDGIMADWPPTAILLPDGRVLLVGSHSAELYDASTGTFTPTGNMTTSLGCKTATLLGTGKVLFVDQPPPFGSSANAALYDPAAGTFSPTGAYASAEMAQRDHALSPNFGDWDCPKATLLADGRVLIVGGIAAELYDPGPGTFSLTGTLFTFQNGWMTTLPEGWTDPSRATLLLNGMVLFNGGDEDLGPGNRAWLYNPSTGTFTATGKMTAARGDHTATLLPDGTVLIAGSFSTSPGPRTLASAELYNPDTGAFSTTGDMSTGREYHTATLLNNGKVLIAGGITNPNSCCTFSPVSSAELYNPPLLVIGPILLSLSGDGQGQGAILHAGTARIASSSEPASTGEALEVYCTGLADGGVIPPQVTIGGRMAEVLFFGKAPGYLGLNQVNVRVPSGVAPGQAVSVRLTYLSRPSNEVTIGVR